MQSPAEAALLSEIHDLDQQLADKRKKWHDEFVLPRDAQTKQRIAQADSGKGDFSLEELCYAAYARCACGAGMAYPKHSSPHGSWHCADILRGVASREKEHSPSLPFMFYEVKSENQPSANGATTRPTAA